MSLFNNISKKIANLILAKKQKLNQRHVEFHNMKSARQIGIIFDADNNTDNKIVENFYKDLKNQGYNVNAAGWFTGHDIPKKTLNSLDFIYFSDKDSNWKGIPQTHEISEFFKQKFDILFVLTQSDSFPVHYIATLSEAAFKVGAYNKDRDYLDFMIEIKEQASIKNLIQDSINYLSEIKKKLRHDITSIHRNWSCHNYSLQCRRKHRF